ncbi:hypothetical protein MCOR25_004232 [Pyricularia grisea]|nr:hypothetical protein MCOR25_004232 [Pyricularia grisea]
MTSPRRSSSATGSAERMVSHNRYTDEQKRFFAIHLKLWSQKQISKDEVIKRFQEKFKDPRFGYSQYRYLRQEVGRDVEFGAPLLQIHEQNTLITAPQPASYVQSFPYQQQQTASAPQGSYEDQFAGPVTDSSPLPQQDFSGGYDDFPDLELLLEDGAQAPPAAAVLTSTRGFAAFVPSQHQQQQYRQQPDATDAFKCSGGGPCTIPLGAPHRHELNGSIVFPNEKAIAGMLATEKILMGVDNMRQEIDGTNSKPPVSSSATGYPFTATTTLRSNYAAVPATRDIKSNSIFAGFEYESPHLQDQSTSLGTTTGRMNLDSNQTDMVFDDDMLNQLCNDTTSQGTTRGTDSMYLPTTMATQYPFFELPTRDPWMPTNNPPDSSLNYAITNPTGLPNLTQASSYHHAPRIQAGMTASPSDWRNQQLGRMTTQQPVAAMTIPHRGVGSSHASTGARQLQNRNTGFGFDMGAGGMQTAYSPSTTAVVPQSMWPQNASPTVIDPDLTVAATSEPSQCFDTKGAGESGALM